MPVARSIWRSWRTVLWCFSPWLWVCCVFGGGVPWPARITRCYSVTSRCSHPDQVKARARAQPGVHNLFFHLRTLLQMKTWKMCKAPASSRSCTLARACWEPLTEALQKRAVVKELCSETSSGSAFVVLVSDHPPLPQHNHPPLTSS